ncbi:MAG: hypothetical protein ACOYXT_02560, partial [Bacteroidota bacterium]
VTKAVVDSSIDFYRRRFLSPSLATEQTTPGVGRHAPRPASSPWAVNDSSFEGCCLSIKNSIFRNDTHLS